MQLNVSFRKSVDIPNKFSENEDRYLMLRLSSRLRILVVSYCLMKGGSEIRIISTRKAGKKEQPDPFIQANHPSYIRGIRMSSMKTLIFGAGPLGCFYAHLLYEAGKDVTILARGRQYDFIKKNGVVLENEMTGERAVSKLNVVDRLEADDTYDLVVVLIRKNKLLPVFLVLGKNENVRNILFMGNNALGFAEYLKHLPQEKVLFGFPGAGGGRKEHVIHYVDREEPKGKRIPVRIGEIDGEMKERTIQIRSLFENSGVPVESVKDIDGWLKYHVAFVSPIANALYMQRCDNFALAKDRESIRLLIRACKEGGNVLWELGYRKRQPFKFNLFYWMPEFVTIKIFQGMFNSKYAEIAFAMHLKAAADELRELANEFKILVDKSSVKTPHIDRLRGYIP